MSDEKGKIGIDENFWFRIYFISIKLASISPITAVKLYSNILGVGEIVGFSYISTSHSKDLPFTLLSIGPTALVRKAYHFYYLYLTGWKTIKTKNFTTRYNFAWTAQEKAQTSTLDFDYLLITLWILSWNKARLVTELSC